MSPTFLTDVNKIESVQRRATRYVQNVSNLPYHERLTYLNLPTLSYRRFRADMITTYNIFHNNVNLDSNEFFQLRVNSITRGVRSHYFSHRVINHWNNLPCNVANATSTEEFKKNFDNYFNPHNYN